MATERDLWLTRPLPRPEVIAMSPADRLARKKARVRIRETARGPRVRSGAAKVARREQANERAKLAGTALSLCRALFGEDEWLAYLTGILSEHPEGLAAG